MNTRFSVYVYVHISFEYTIRFGLLFYWLLAHSSLAYITANFYS